MPSRTEAHREYERILKDATERGQYPQAVRDLALNDLFFLLVYVFHRIDLNRDWLYERCREVQADPDGRLDLWAREHYKSTIITYALTIQDILNDPELTVGIFSFNRPIAKAFLRQIKREFESNETLVSLFPDILYANPKKDAPKWSEDDGIIVKRKGNPKEATVEAWGLVDGSPTSKHYRLMIYDDVVTRESVTTPEMIDKVNQAWELSRNLTAEDGGRTRYIGTRYHYADTYSLMMERQAAIPRIYPATDTGTLEGVPVLISPDRLVEKRREMGPYVFACQMLQDPKQDDPQGFQEDWLRYWPADNFKGLNVYILVDPAGEKKKANDYTVFTVLGMGADHNYYVLTWVRDRLNLTERANVLFALHRDYNPIKVGYEKVGLQSDIEHFEDRMNRENYRFTITPIHSPVPKNDRIRALVPLFEQGRVWIPESCIRSNYEHVSEDLTRVFIRNEYKAFPYCVHDDMLDDMANILNPKFRAAFPQATDGIFGLKPGATDYAAPYDPIAHGMPSRTRRELDDYAGTYDPLRQ